MNTLNGLEYDGNVVRACEDCGAVHNGNGVWVRPTFARRSDWNKKITFLCGRCGQKPENQTAAGRVCSLDKHDTMADVLACPQCEEANQAEAARVQRVETIDPDQPWGQHIALTCVNHPALRWHTKNISHIGARSIFFAGQWPEVECSCSGNDLRVVK